MSRETLGELVEEEIKRMKDKMIPEYHLQYTKNTDTEVSFNITTNTSVKDEMFPEYCCHCDDCFDDCVLDEVDYNEDDCDIARINNITNKTQCEYWLPKPLLIEELKCFGDYWDTRIEYYKKEFPVIFNNIGYMNQLWAESFNLWKVLHPETYNK